ncbi:MAG: glycosyl hydrolase 115 family protein, partial [Desulfuromonadales bacterium]|nr:glycosyl hydrolase 115 family protein [Desulfuromonadales bacterium]
MKRKSLFHGIVFIINMVAISLTSYAGEINQHGTLRVLEKATGNSFPIIDAQKRSTPIWVDENDFKVVRIAAKLLSEDVERITEVRPPVVNQENKLGSSGIVIGTIGKSEVIDRLIAEKKLNVDSIKDQWEAFTITSVDSKLVIAGADRRGTAFGVFTLTRKMGVSPLVWWSEVMPEPKEELHVMAADYWEGSPSVKYRGMFINDECFGWKCLHDWARKHMDPEDGHIGPNTYEKMFELLLRLKANYIWPAMHGPSKWFYKNPRSPELADDYAIVVGSSHCEQMLRNNNTEWDKKTMGDWNYKTNRERIMQYWDDRLKEAKNYENSYTLGLRGVHDWEMEGAKSVEEMVEITQQTLEDQRNILRKNLGDNIEDVSQILCTYKEVLVT